MRASGLATRARASAAGAGQRAGAGGRGALGPACDLMSIYSIVYNTLVHLLPNHQPNLLWNASLVSIISSTYTLSLLPGSFILPATYPLSKLKFQLSYLWDYCFIFPSSMITLKNDSVLFFCWCFRSDPTYHFLHPDSLNFRVLSHVRGRFFFQFSSSKFKSVQCQNIIFTHVTKSETGLWIYWWIK